MILLILIIIIVVVIMKSKSRKKTSTTTINQPISFKRSHHKTRKSRYKGKYNSRWWINYRKYLKSQKWRQFRLHKLEQTNYTCQKCGLHSKHLDVHHLTYKHLGHEHDTDVIVLCHKCHQHLHQRKF